MSVNSFLNGAEANARTMHVEPNAAALAMAYHASSPALADHRRHLILNRNLAVGDNITGRVDVVIDYGAFIDSEGLCILLLISDISWRRVSHPADVLMIGELIKVRISRIAPDSSRISVSLKALQPDPWVGIETKYQLNSWASGCVTALHRYGVFVELEFGIDGLIPLSEIAPDMSGAPSREGLSIGQVVCVRLLVIDVSRRRMLFGLR